MRQFILYSLFFFLSIPSFAQTTWLVESNSDAATPVGGQHTLRSAIAAAASGDIIEFSPNTDGTPIIFASFINITKALTIKGNGMAKTILDGNNATRMLYTTEALVLENMTLRNGNFIGSGAALGSRKDLTLKSCRFSNNISGGGGAGAVYYFHNNGVAHHLEVDNCIFEGNSSGNGGAMYIATPLINSTHAIRNSTFTGNSATGFGGAFYIFGGSFNMFNTQLIGNSGDVAGGAAYIAESDMTVMNTTVVNNSSSQGHGGGLYVAGGVFNLTNSTVAGNQALFDAGGLFVFTSSGGNPSEFHLRNSIVSHNNANGNPDMEVNAGVTSVLHGGNFISKNTTTFTTTSGTNLLGTVTSPINPLFVNLSLNDVRLKACSPAIDLGDNTLIAQDLLDVDQDGNSTEQVDIDLTGLNRIYSTTNVDAGAYEFQAQVLNGTANPFFYYTGGQTYCQNQGIILPVAAAGGYFSVINGGSSQLGLNSSTGAIDLDVAVPGTYLVRHTLTSCTNMLSFATFPVTILPTTTTTLNITICDGDSYTLGCDTYTQSGTYTQTSYNANGCEEITVLNLTVAPNPTATINQNINSTVFGQVVASLEASGSGGSGNYSYTWMQDGNAIAMGPVLTEPCSGVVYTLIVTDQDTGCQGSVPYSFYNRLNACKATAEPTLSARVSSSLTLYPNPNRGKFTLQGEHFNIAHFTVYDDMGNVVVNQTVTEYEHLSINLQGVKKGVYLIKAFNAQGEAIDKRFVVE